MSEALRVRAYSGLSGDAILVSIPEKAGRKRVTRHLLIDVGHTLGDSGGGDSALEPVVRDIQNVLDGRPLDLYVMTHEHRDQVQGLYVASTQHQLHLDVDYAWLTASAAKDYHDAHPMAKEKRDALRTAYLGIERFLAAAPALHSPMLRELMLNNDPRRPGRASTTCEGWRGRGRPTSTGAANSRARIRSARRRSRSWPPRRTRRPTTAGPARWPSAWAGATDRARSRPCWIRCPRPASMPAPSSTSSRRGGADTPRPCWRSTAPPTTRASSSPCAWRGWRLLFPGDAESRSWRTIKTQLGTLEPVHFLKVGRHGTPPAEILEEIFPKTPRERGRRKPVVCTCADAYAGASHNDTLDRLRRRCTVTSAGPGEPLEFTFPG